MYFGGMLLMTDLLKTLIDPHVLQNVALLTSDQGLHYLQNIKKFL